ncbi:MAG: hypothetical protein ACFFCW_30280 [Candidatus Hodarchaeota archaeon]
MTVGSTKTEVFKAVWNLLKEHYQGLIFGIVIGFVLFYVGAIFLPDPAKTLAIQYHPTLPDYLKREDKTGLVTRGIIDCLYAYQTRVSSPAKWYNGTGIEGVRPKAEKHDTCLAILDDLIKTESYARLASIDLMFANRIVNKCQKRMIKQDDKDRILEAIDTSYTNFRYITRPPDVLPMFDKTLIVSDINRIPDECKKIIGSIDRDFLDLRSHRHLSEKEYYKKKINSQVQKIQLLVDTTDELIKSHTEDARQIENDILEMVYPFKPRLRRFLKKSWETIF